MTPPYRLCVINANDWCRPRLSSSRTSAAYYKGAVGEKVGNPKNLRLLSIPKLKLLSAPNGL